MIPFDKIDLSQREKYNCYLQDGTERGCEYSFANLYLWDRQQTVEVGEVRQ